MYYYKNIIIRKISCIKANIGSAVEWQWSKEIIEIQEVLCRGKNNFFFYLLIKGKKLMR
jgi:hypothetical protein